MGNFVGSVVYSVDPKGRFNFPANMKKSLREDAEETFIIVKGDECCLYAYPNDQWEERLENINSLELEDEVITFQLRDILDECVTAKLDANQRLTLSKDFLNKVKISDKIKIKGVLNRVEFWNPEVYEEYKQNNLDKQSRSEIRRILLNSNFNVKKEKKVNEKAD